MDNKNKILLILTGGTICSYENAIGEKKPNAEGAKSLIESIFRQSDSFYKNVEFEEEIPLNILSENMTPNDWSVLLDGLKKYNMESYRGVIILHGTDTLAYTSSMLSLVLAGLDVPVMLVSSQEPLTDEKTNGNENFKTAVNLIMNGIEPNVYVVYKNMNGEMLIHLGSHLLQSANHTDDFSSRDAKKIEDLKNPKEKGVIWESDDRFFEKIDKFSASVLKITPYVGLDYSCIDTRGIKAVVHGTYHSQTLCVGSEDSRFSPYSMKGCFDEDKKATIPFFVEPCDYEEGCGESVYETTADIVKSGAIPAWGMTSEMLYVKTMVGVALGYLGDDLVQFVTTTKINHETHY